MMAMQLSSEEERRKMRGKNGNLDNMGLSRLAGYMSRQFPLGVSIHMTSRLPSFLFSSFLFLLLQPVQSTICSSSSISSYLKYPADRCEAFKAVIAYLRLLSSGNIINSYVKRAKGIQCRDSQVKSSINKADSIISPSDKKNPDAQVKVLATMQLCYIFHLIYPCHPSLHSLHKSVHLGVCVVQKTPIATLGQYQTSET